MTRDELIHLLKTEQCLDLYDLYHRNPERSFYDLVEELYQLREELGVTTALSAFNSEIEGLVESVLNGDVNTINADNFKEIERSLDLNRRAHKMSRFILTKDNHHQFSRPVDLVMYGDSITEWGPWHDALHPISLANRGLAGDTTEGMIQRLDTSLACSPKLVCVMAGINDLAQGYSVSSVFENYKAILETWQQNNIEVWVQSTLYVGKRLASLNPLVTELNQALQTYCAEQGHTFIDLNTHLSPNKKLPLDCSCDDLHLNSKAYSQWLEVLSPKLKQALLPNM